MEPQVLVTFITQVKSFTSVMVYFILGNLPVRCYEQYTIKKNQDYSFLERHVLHVARPTAPSFKALVCDPIGSQHH
jgi:hypothetical protein